MVSDFWSTLYPVTKRMFTSVCVYPWYERSYFFISVDKILLAQKPNKEWVITFCGTFFPRFVGKKKHSYNTAEILILFSVKIGLICVWVLRILDKTPITLVILYIFFKLEINFITYIIKYLYQYFLFFRRNIE